MKLTFSLVLRYWAMLFIGVIYLIAFALPAFDNSAAPFHHMSWQPRGLNLGISAFFHSFFLFIHPGWLANPLFWAAMVLFAKGKYLLAAILSWVAVGLGASYLLIMSDQTLFYEQKFLIGFYVWLTSIAAFASCSTLWLLADKWLQRRHRRSDR